jgi:hypothetical protein
MSAVGGSIESVSISGRNFSVAADADASRKLGGFENEMQVNGDGTDRVIKTRVAWMISGLTLSVDPDRGDHEFLQAISDGTARVPISITYAGSETYAGTGIVTGELSSSSQSATVEVELSGGGKLEKQ